MKLFNFYLIHRKGIDIYFFLRMCFLKSNILPQLSWSNVLKFSFKRAYGHFTKKRLKINVGEN